MSQAFLIPPSSNFLKTLANFFLSNHSLKKENILKIWCIFPTKRSGLFFKHYIKEKNKKLSAGFLPKILSFEEFIENLYTLLLDKPFPKIPTILRLFILLEAAGQKEEDFNKFFNWGLKFLEVFEEFEKEGRIPEDLLYPPEGLPEIAKKLFEELRKTYEKFSALLEKKEFSYPSYRLKKLAETFRNNSLSNKNLFEEINEIWFIGFAALRKAETEIFKFFKNNFNKTFFIFEAYEPIPQIIQNTLRALELEPQFLDSKYYENLNSKAKPRIYFYETSDLHLEVESAVKNIPDEVKNPDEVAVILPNSLSLLPLIYGLENKENNLEINITLQYPITKLPLNQLLNNIIKAQKERNGKFYPVRSYLKVIKHPYLKALTLDSGLPLEFLIKEIEKLIREKGYIKIKLSEIENWFLNQKDFLEKLHRIFFRNWEEIEAPIKLAENLKEFISFLKPLFENLKADNSDWHNVLLRNYLHVLENKILSIFEEESYLKEKKISKAILLEILEYLLKEESIPFIGDPLKGLQIMGFLETRLLSFKKVIILDVNEGILPPSPSFNPLLTDEIKHYLGIPVYKNELWVYYFERLIQSAEEVHIFYLFVEKSKTQDFKEPSRFIHKLKWELEKNNEKPESKIINLELNILSQRDGIPKTQEDRKNLIKLLQTTEISRYFLETYLRCGVQFYFKYLLKLKEAEKIGLKPVDVGNFLHEFFESFFKSLEGNNYLIKNIYNENEVLKNLELLWNKYEFNRKMNALSHFFSKKIAIESIKKYFDYLIKLEEKKVKNNKVLGVEKVLILKEKINFLDSFKDFSGNQIDVILKGICDFIIKREEGIPKYLILDYKSNPNTRPATKKIKELFDFKLPGDFSQEAIYEVADAFGQKLYNFQLLFYYYLFYQKKDKFIEEPKGCFYIINAGFITPSDLETPEKFIFTSTNVKNRDWPKVYNYFQNDFKHLIEWIINHLLFSEKFYFAFDENVCKFCEYQAPCKNFKYLL